MLLGPSCRNITTEQPGLKGLCPKSKNGYILIESNRLCMVVFQERAARVDSVTSITGWSLPSCKSMKGTCLSNSKQSLLTERWLEPSSHHQSIPTMFWQLSIQTQTPALMISKLCPSAFPLWWHVWVSKPHEPSQFCKSKLCPWRIRPIDPDWEGPAEYVLYDIIWYYIILYAPLAPFYPLHVPAFIAIEQACIKENNKSVE